MALDPKFAENSLVYLSYAEPGDDGKAGTAVARGKLGTDGLDNVQVIFRQYPKVDGGNHFGSRLVFAPDGKLFVTLGERFTVRPGARPGHASRQDRAHQSRRLGAAPTIRSSDKRARCPRSGPMAIAIRKAPPFTPRPASFGRPSSARSAATN